MPFRWSPREHVSLIRYVIKWLLIGLPVGALVGSAVALFLWLLDWATRTRWAHPSLLLFLPLGGVAIGIVYHFFGKSAEGGNNLIIDEIHQPGGGVPMRMAPLVLFGTIATHLFGGSAGREGTAVQMGGSIASTIARRLRIGEENVPTLLMTGVAAGFGAVFGTPVTGAVFAVEVLAIGLISYRAILPCLIASIVADATTASWGIHHTGYGIRSLAHPLAAGAASIDLVLLGKVAMAGIAFGLASVLFAELTHSLHRVFKLLIPKPYLRPAAGGAIVIAMVYLLGTRDYLGLGVTADPNHPDAVTILSCFDPGGATPWSWWWKILFTAVTLGAGFKGGEVTPLFFVGAAMGNAIAGLTGAPTDLMAGLGFIAVFAGATNTPLACTIMGIELFGGTALLGSGFAVYAAVACFMAYIMSGHSGIYLSQRIGTAKGRQTASAGVTSIGEERERRPTLKSLFK